MYTDFSYWSYAGDWTDYSSNYAQDPYPCASLHYAAPGKNVVSLKPGGGPAEWYGTSMAAPHVAAIMLLLQNNLGIPGSYRIAINDPDGHTHPIIYH